MTHVTYAADSMTEQSIFNRKDASANLAQRPNFMNKPGIQKDFIEELSEYSRSKDHIIDNDKVFLTCDVCQCKAHGSHMWVKDEKYNENNGRLTGYDWIKYPEAWMVMWTANGPIQVCSKMCAVKLNTDLFYEDD